MTLQNQASTNAEASLEPPERSISHQEHTVCTTASDTVGAYTAKTAAKASEVSDQPTQKKSEGDDLEKAPPTINTKPDIEHVWVKDDPRLWSSRKKLWTLVYISYCSLAGATLANIYFPAIAQIQSDLHASDEIIALSGSLFILMQGIIPLIWSMISEIYGRKPVYLASLTICFIGTLVNGLAKSAASFLVCRVISALGSSAVLTVGAGTLADMYEPHERGARVGVFYSFPLIGPSLGSLLGGALTTGGGWRAPFYLMAGYLFSTVALTFFYLDTFRPERSAAWQAARTRYEAHREAGKSDANKYATYQPAGPSLMSRMASNASAARRSVKPFHPKFSDISPFAATRLIMTRWNNVLVMLMSGLLFGAQFQLSYLASIVLAAPPWNYDPLKIGLVLLAFGGDNVIGSVLGGRYSDLMLRRLTKQNNGVREAEMRIKSTYVAMPLAPLAFVAYAWTIQEHTNIAGPIVALLIGGISVLWVYSSSLAYIVDANPGRASTAIAYNSAMRGSSAFVAIEIGVPLLDAMGNGWLFTGWAILIVLSEVLLVFVSFRGQQLRHRAIDREEVSTPNDTA